MRCTIWYHLYNLKKRKKHSWRSVTFSKVAGFTKSNTPPWAIFRLHKWYQIAQRITCSQFLSDFKILFTSKFQILRNDKFYR